MIKISRKSWHYRFHRLTTKELPSDNIIDYWSQVIWNIIVAIVISILGFIAIPYLFGNMFFEPLGYLTVPLNSYKAFFLTLLMGYTSLAIIFILIVGYVYLEDRYALKKIRAKRDKIIVPKSKPEWSRIEFVDEE